MKLIFHFAFFGYFLVVLDSALISSKKEIFEYLPSSRGDDDSEGRQNNNLNSDEAGSNKQHDIVLKEYKESSTFQQKADSDDEDYDVERQRAKNEVWARKYADFNAANKLNQNEVSSNKNQALKGKADKNVAGKDTPTFMSEYKNGDGVDQVIPLTQSPLKHNIAKKLFHMDPVLNSLRRHPAKPKLSHRNLPQYSIQPNIVRRVDYRRKNDEESSTGSSSSSSREMKDFKEEFRELWLHKKFEALNQTGYRGDKVNMVAARPFGVPCGDPNQHDMPWGVCMLAAECEPEFRIYRGDLFCGRTQFICCGMQLTTYDTYQAFDVSFDDKSLSTDSEERKNIGSKEKKKRKRTKDRRKRKRARDKRKKKIKKHIRKIIKEIRKILNRQYRNGTKQRKRRTKQLKKFVKDLKKQYKKDRQSVTDMHANEMMKIDYALMERLKQIQKVNKNLAANATFREIILSGYFTKKSARMLLEAYPELDEFLEARRMGKEKTRRSGGGVASQDSDEELLEYDVEYGYLYY